MTLAATDIASGVQLWDLGRRALGPVDSGSQPGPRRLPVFSPDGTLLAFGVPYGEVIIWTAPEGGCEPGRVRPRGLACHRLRTRQPVAGSVRRLDATINVLDTLTGLQHWKADLGQGPTTGLAYSPDGKTIIASHDGALSFLDSATGELRHAH